MSFKELKQNTLKVSFLHCDGVIWCRDTGIINIWDLITYLSNEKFVKAVFTLAADFVFSHAVQFLRSLGFMLLCLDCQTCFWASVWAPRCLELLLPAFFSVSLSLPCCQLVAFLRPLGPPRSCRFSPPGASVAVCHIEGLEVCGFCPVPSLFLTWAFAAAPGSQDEICCFQTELSWTRFWLWDLLHVFLLFPWRHSATPTAFSWSFSLSFLSLGSSLSRFSPPVLSLWALLLIHLFEFLAKFLSFSYGGSSSPWAFCISSFTSSILRHVPLVLSSQLRRLLDIQLNGLGVSGKAPDPLLINVPEAGVSLGLLS